MHLVGFTIEIPSRMSQKKKNTSVTEDVANVAILTECRYYSCDTCHLLSGVHNVTHYVRKWLEAICKEEDIKPPSAVHTQGQQSRDIAVDRATRLPAGRSGARISVGGKIFLLFSRTSRPSSHAPHNDVSVNAGTRTQRRSHNYNIIIRV